MTFFSFLSKFDLFRLPISFLYDKHPTHSTVIGLLFSFSIYAFMIFTFSQSDAFFKKSPMIISQTLSNKYADQIDFSNSTFIGFQLTDENQNFYYDPSIFSIQLRRLVFERNKYGVTVPLKQYFEILRPCVQEDSAFDPEMFENSGMKGSFCLNNKTFSIYGQITEQNYSFFSVAVFPCDNLTSKNTCKSMQEINKFLSNGKYLTMAMHNSIINVEDYENPMKVSYKGIITSIDINLSKTSFIYLKKNILKYCINCFFLKKLIIKKNA